MVIKSGSRCVEYNLVQLLRDGVFLWMMGESGRLGCSDVGEECRDTLREAFLRIIDMEMAHVLSMVLVDVGEGVLD